MNDPRHEQIRFPVPIASPCCGPNMLVWGYFYGAKVYICRNCMNFVERKDALPLVREGRRLAKERFGNALRIINIPSGPHRTGDTVKIDLRSSRGGGEHD